MKKKLLHLILGSIIASLFTRRNSPIIILSVFGYLNLAANSDLEILIIPENIEYEIYDHVLYNVHVQNLGPIETNNVSVRFSLPQSMVHSSNDASQGEYNLQFKIWNIGKLEVGQIVSLSLNLFAIDNKGPKVVFAQIQTSDQSDPDSTPGNNINKIPSEDDEDRITIYPIEQENPADHGFKLLDHKGSNDQKRSNKKQIEWVPILAQIKD